MLQVVKPRFIEPIGERTTLPKVDARWLCDTLDNGARNLSACSFSPAAMWNLHTTKYFVPTYSEVINLTGLL
jgi:hypothetical protein